MTTLTEKTRVGDLVASHPQARKVLERRGIDYCCGGQRTLAQAAVEGELDWQVLREELAVAMRSERPAGERDWSRASLTDLVEHILRTHHVYLRMELPRLRQLVARVLPVHRAHAETLELLAAELETLADEIDGHLVDEERLLVPDVVGLELVAGGAGQPSPGPPSGLQAMLEQMRQEHELAGAALERIRQITGGHQPPDDACPSLTALYEGLARLEDDLHQHIHLENNILYPRTQELASRLRSA